MTTYQIAKQSLKEIAKEAKQNFTNDLPAIRMIINDYADELSKEFNLTEHKRELLVNYSITLHPKK